MSDDQVSIEINGIALKARRGAMVIEAADGAGIEIPRFCYHKKLSVAANCRMCLVEVEKAPKPLPACATPVAEGMKVHTQSALALRAQKSVMEFLLINHPLDCPICDQGGECELQDVAMGYGRDVSRFNERKRVVKDKDIGPLIATDMTRCIHCTRCVRFGEEIGGVPELGATGRGEHMEIGTYIARSVDSELSGNVIDLCPVGALTSKPFRFRARAWEMRQRPALAPHDCVVSNVDVHIARGRVMRVVPRENEDVNETWISDRDRFSYEGLYHEDRLLSPMIKRDGRWEATDWDTALSSAAEGLRAVVEKNGGQSLGSLASPSATLEELYLLQKLTRALGSHNVDHRLREVDVSDQAAAPLSPGLGQSLSDLGKVGAALLVGSWLRKDQPMANHRLRQAALAGAHVMAINPIDFEFNFPLAERIITDPTGMVMALAGVARALEGRSKKQRPEEIAALLDAAAPDAQVKAVAERLKGAGKSAILLGPLAFAHPRASALRALAAYAGALCEAVVGCLPDGANGAGAWLAGAVPHRAEGGSDCAAAGLSASAMLAGGLRGYLVLGFEADRDTANGPLARQALEQAEFVVCLTGFRSESTDACANVLLPTALFAENEGTYVNLEGRWASFEPALKPAGEARPAWKILRVLANRLVLDGFEQLTAADVRGEVRAACGVETPKSSGTWSGGSVLASGEDEGIVRIGYVPVYAVDPIVRRSMPLQSTVDAGDAAARMNAALASQLGVSSGDRVRTRCGAAAVDLEVRVDERVADRCVLVMAGVDGSAALGPNVGPISLEKL